MSAVITVKTSYGALPVKFDWRMASARLRFNGLLVVFTGPSLGLNVDYNGPLIAELNYVDGELERSRFVSFVAQAVVSDHTGADRTDWQLQLNLPKTISVKNTSHLIVYLAFPPGSVAVTDKSSPASKWRVKYGLDGNFE